MPRDSRQRSARLPEQTPEISKEISMSHRPTGLALASALGVLTLGSTGAAALPACADLAAMVLADTTVLAATSTITLASGSNPAYCQVNVTQFHAINIRVGLPLSAADGGTGGVQGAW